MTVGRNDPCPCGSGKKHKHCCMGKLSKQQMAYSQGLRALLAILFILVVVGVVSEVYSSDHSSDGPTRVWSPEHGHWHEVR